MYITKRDLLWKILLRERELNEVKVEILTDEGSLEDEASEELKDIVNKYIGYNYEK